MILQAGWRSQRPQFFYPAFKTFTDYGACCLITPYLDFEINKTNKLTEEGYSYTGSDYHSIPKGLSRNGIQNGLKMILDVENFDYAYFPRGAQGIRAVVGDARDKDVINQNGFYISAGNKNKSWKMDFSGFKTDLLSATVFSCFIILNLSR